MILHLDDISVFMANWETKVDNIRQIQQILNIGFDSMVFIDDNPFERNMVKENIAGITVPDMPEDPSCYLEYLYSLNLLKQPLIVQPIRIELSNIRYRLNEQLSANRLPMKQIS